MELTSIAALILGIYGSIKFTDISYDFFLNSFPSFLENVNENHLKIASFVFTFFIIIVLISVAGKLITKALKLVFLGFANKVFGGLFGLFKFTLLLSICFVFFENLNSIFQITEKDPSEYSFLYSTINNLGDFLLKSFNLNNTSFNFFN